MRHSSDVPSERRPNMYPHSRQLFRRTKPRTGGTWKNSLPPVHQLRAAKNNWNLVTRRTNPVNDAGGAQKSRDHTPKKHTVSSFPTWCWCLSSSASCTDDRVSTYTPSHISYRGRIRREHSDRAIEKQPLDCCWFCCRTRQGPPLEAVD